MSNFVITQDSEVVQLYDYWFDKCHRMQNELAELDRKYEEAKKHEEKLMEQLQAVRDALEWYKYVNPMGHGWKAVEALAKIDE